MQKGGNKYERRGIGYEMKPRTGGEKVLLVSGDASKLQ